MVRLFWKMKYFGFPSFFCRRSRKALFLGKRKSYLAQQWRERSCLRVSFLFLSIFDKGQWQAWFSRQQLQKQIFPLDNIGNILLAMIEVVVVLLFCLWLWQPACKRCVCIEVKREICYSFIFLYLAYCIAKCEPPAIVYAWPWGKSILGLILICIHQMGSQQLVVKKRYQIL